MKKLSWLGALVLLLLTGTYVVVVYAQDQGYKQLDKNEVKSMSQIKQKTKRKHIRMH